MADLNKVMLIGRLSRDPQLRYLPSQSAVCDFGFAVGRKYKLASGESKEETCFVDCTVFGKGAEIFNQYMAKGKQCYLEGRLRLDQWDDKTTGQKRSKLTVVVEEFQFLGSPRDGQAGGDEGGGQARSGGYGSGPTRAPASRGGTQRPAPQQQPEAEPPYGDEQQFKDDDIPF